MKALATFLLATMLATAAWAEGISSSGGGGGLVGASTPITGTCPNGNFLYNNAGVLGCSASSATIALPQAVTGGVSGGVPYFSGASTMSASALLVANAIVIGGGAGVAPATTATAAGILTFLGTPSSANLAAAVTDETGTGLLVFATNPVFTTPNLGTPSALTLTNATGLPVAGLSNLGTGVGTWLVTPSSANLASAITDETGSGLAVFSIAPTFTTTVQLGTVSVGTGQLKLANAGSALLTTIQAGAAVAARTYTWPTDFGAAGTVLTDAAGNGTLSWAAGGGGVSNPLTLTRLLTITQSQANEGILASTGYSLTGANAQNMLDLAGTWNTSGNPVALKVAITNTASGASSKVIQLLTGPAGATEVFSVNALGTASLYAGLTVLAGNGNSAGITASPTTGNAYITNGTATANVSNQTINGVANTITLYSLNTVNLWSGSGVYQMGPTDAAAPTAVKLSVQSVVAGTTNTAGADWTLVGSLSTGSGVAGKIKFGLSQISAGATAQNASTVVLSLNTITASGIQFPTYGAGALSTDASGNITATSDERLKDVVRHFDAGLAELEKIQPIVYRWKASSGMETEHEYAGLGAGNVRDTIPEAVGQTRDGYLTLSDRAIIAAEINAIKELAGELSAVKAEQGRLEQHLWYMEMKR